MGVLNPRAVCPNCGGKIHTQGGLLGDVIGHTTGRQCPLCGVALTGKINPLTNQAQLVPRPEEVARREAAKKDKAAAKKLKAAEKKAKAEAKADAEKAIAEDDQRYSVTLTSLPKPDKAPTGWSNKPVYMIWRAWRKQMGLKGEQTNVLEAVKHLPQRLDDLTRPQAEKLVDQLRIQKAGFELSPEFPPPPSVTTEPQVDADAKKAIAKEIYGDEQLYSVTLTSLPKPDKKLTALANVSVKEAWKKATGTKWLDPDDRIVEALTNLPQRLDDLDRGQAKKLVDVLRSRKAGFEVSPELPTPGSVTADEQAGTDEQPDTLAQIEKLGQLNEAGVLTDEEFQVKKAELLERL